MSYILTEVTEDEENVDTDTDFCGMQFEMEDKKKIVNVMLGSLMFAMLAVFGEPVVNKTLGDSKLYIPWWWEYLQCLMLLIILLIDCYVVADVCGCVFIQETCFHPILERVFPDSDFLGPFLWLFCVSGVSFAIVFWSTLYVIPSACTYYSATTLSINTTLMNFTHINCPSLAVPTVTLYGHFGVIAALWVLYGVNVIKPDFERESVAELALDFLDLQDFALLLVDDEVLKSRFGVAEDGQGSWGLWKVLMVFSLLAFISIVVQFLITYRWSDTPEDDAFTWWDCGMRMLSLGLVEVPFASLRLYTSYAFGIPSSPMLIKNFLSIVKEALEIGCCRKFPLSALKAALSGEIKASEIRDYEIGD